MTTTNITLRAAEHPADYPQIAALFNTVLSEPITAETMQGWMVRKPEGQIEDWQVVVTPSGQIVGYSENAPMLAINRCLGRIRW